MKNTTIAHDRVVIRNICTVLSKIVAEFEAPTTYKLDASNQNVTKERLLDVSLEATPRDRVSGKTNKHPRAINS